MGGTIGLPGLDWKIALEQQERGVSRGSRVFLHGVLH